MPEPIQLISVSKADVARIIAQWWAEYQADPSKFSTGPDNTGESSADTFFRIAVDLGIALPPVTHKCSGEENA